MTPRHGRGPRDQGCRACKPRDLGKNTELSIYDLVARKLTENIDENVDTEEEISFDEFTITGSYSDYDILEEEKLTITKNDNVWVKTKK